VQVRVRVRVWKDGGGRNRLGKEWCICESSFGSLKSGGMGSSPLESVGGGCDESCQRCHKARISFDIRPEIG